MLWSVRRKFDWLHLCKRASDYNFRFAILRIMPPLVLDGHACIHIVLLLCVPTIQRTIIVLSHFFFCSFHLLFILLKGKFLGFVREYIYIYIRMEKRPPRHIIMRKYRANMSCLRCFNASSLKYGHEFKYYK